VNLCGILVAGRVRPAAKVEPIIEEGSCHNKRVIPKA
jgi:hypothetical protein